MPRYYRRRYSRVIVRPKKKWASNIVNVGTTAVASQNTCLFYAKMCENSNATSVPTPTILKTGNFKLQLDATFVLSAAAAVEFSAYVVYVPEGMFNQIVGYNDAQNLIQKHPEWVMCWKFGSNDFISGNGNVDSIKVSSRLKRNLNSGDAIYFLGLAQTAQGITFTTKDCRGVCQFWTCAN